MVNVLNQKLSEDPDSHKIKYFDIEKETRKSLKKLFYLIADIPKERIKIELDKVFTK